MTARLNRLKARLPTGDRLYSLLGISAIAVVVVGYAVITASSLLPGVRAWEEASARVESAQKALAEARSAQTRAPDLLRQKVATAEARRLEIAAMFASEQLASEMPTRLYQYAGESGVEIVSLQAQPPQSGGDKALYSIRSFDVQALGPLRGLAGLVARVGETSQGIVISNLSISKKDEARHSLAMTITLYTSPHVGTTPATTAGAQLTATPAATPAPTAVGSPTPTAPPQPVIYTVRAGDTLFSIARRYGTSVEAIMAANAMESTNVRAGEQLLIPAQ